MNEIFKIAVLQYINGSKSCLLEKMTKENNYLKRRKIN